MAFDFSDFNLKSQKAIQHVTEDIATLRTGKATVQLLDPVTVEAYGGRMKVSEVAAVTAPDANLLVVKPWDNSIIESIEKAIASAGINLSPVVDGELIRIVIPALTEERRREMVKLLAQKIEGGRVMLRSIRTDAKQEIEDQTGNSDVSEDDIHRDLERLDKSVQDYMSQLDQLAEHKETELMTV